MKQKITPINALNMSTTWVLRRRSAILKSVSGEISFFSINVQVRMWLKLRKKKAQARVEALHQYAKQDELQDLYEHHLELHLNLLHCVAAKSRVELLRDVL